MNGEDRCLVEIEERRFENLFAQFRVIVAGNQTSYKEIFVGAPVEGIDGGDYFPADSIFKLFGGRFREGNNQDLINREASFKE